MRREEAKRQLDLDPSHQKRLAKIAAATQQDNTFGLIADELLVQKGREVKRIGLGEACPPMTSTHTPRTRVPEGSGADLRPDVKGGYLIMLQPAPNYNLSYTNLNTLPACWLSMDVVTLFRVRMS